MTIRLTALAVLAVGFIAVFGCGTAAQAQQATIRPSPQAPVSPNPRSEDELDAYFAVQNAPNAVGRLRLANDFLSDYFDSEFRHLIIRLEWAARGELRHDPEDIIAAALSGIEAQEHFLASKLSFIDNPERVQALPGVRFTLANQKALYYQSIVESYDSQGDFDRVVRYAELALDQQTEALRLHDEMGTVGTEESEQIVTQIQGGRLFVLHTLMRGYQDQGDAQKVVEYGEAIIEITPDDLDTLRTTSMIMSERGPEDPAAVADYFQRAKGHAEVAVREMTRLLDSPEGSQFNDEQKAALLTEVHTTLGMVHFQLEE
jgi:tetratricopeptide (TPR) repeat protein